MKTELNAWKTRPNKYSLYNKNNFEQLGNSYTKKMLCKWADTYVWYSVREIYSYWYFRDDISENKSHASAMRTAFPAQLGPQPEYSRADLPQLPTDLQCDTEPAQPACLL